MYIKRLSRSAGVAQVALKYKKRYYHRLLYLSATGAMSNEVQKEPKKKLQPRRLQLQDVPKISFYIRSEGSAFGSAIGLACSAAAAAAASRAAANSASRASRAAFALANRLSAFALSFDTYSA